MTRVAIIAESEEVRAALAAALRASSAFEVIAVGGAREDVSADAELVVVARAGRPANRLAASLDHEARSAPVLTPREREILGLLADGLSNKQIAARLGISGNTVKTHLELLFEKLDASSRTEAVTKAARMGLLLL